MSSTRVHRFGVKVAQLQDSLYLVPVVAVLAFILGVAVGKFSDVLDGTAKVRELEHRVLVLEQTASLPR